ncbi:MAG: hypothetical protein J6I36_04675 [Bacteroidaceae bacterium]|nr:hypothetical protein [Bacteroidaceae bacterium]
MYYILCYAWGMGEMRGKVNVGAEQCDSIANLLVHVLLNATDDLLKRGLVQGYISNGSEMDCIKGKIDVGKTLKIGRYRQGILYCSHDELTTDILVNQIINATLREALKLQRLSEQNRERIFMTQRRFPQMKCIQLSDSVFKSLHLYGNSMFYQFAINICRLLHQSLLPNKNLPGKLDFSDLMDDEQAMNRIFEKFLMNFYKQEFREEYPNVSRSHIRFQLTPMGMTFTKSTDEAYRLLPVMETDVTLYNPLTKKKIILDAKYYKEMLVSRYGDRGKIRREHLSQILTYVMNQENDAAEHTKKTKGILVYPTVDTELDVSYVYKNTNHVIRVSTVNLNQEWRMIEQRLKDIVKDKVGP